MKRILNIILLALLCTNVFAARPEPGRKASTKTHKAVLIIIDGIPAPTMERLQPPTLMAIARQGHYHRAYCGGEVGSYSETPTVSAIGYTNILTGTWMNKHNVKGNDNQNPNYHYPTLFRIAKDQQRPVTTALYSSWTDNRTVLLGENKAVFMQRPATTDLSYRTLALEGYRAAAARGVSAAVDALARHATHENDKDVRRSGKANPPPPAPPSSAVPPSPAAKPEAK